jgi:hypothetical protein
VQRLGWAGVVYTGIFLFMAVAIVAWRVYGETTVSTLAAVAAVVVGLVPLAIQARSARRAGHAFSTPEQLDHAAERLARTVRVQWEREANNRGLRDPQPILVRWEPAEPEVMDELHPGRGTSHERTAQRLALAGQLGQVVSKFRELPSRRLVVIGEPGSGKTGFLVLLLLGLLEDRRPSEPIPVLLSASSWDPGAEPFHRWVEQSLVRDYQDLLAVEQVGPTATSDLVADGRIMVLLDGLDELDEERRPPALKALNRYGAGKPIVIACRRQEFTQAVKSSDVLTGAAVVDLVPVEPKTAENFLREGTPPDQRRERWQPVFTCMRRGPAGALASAFSTPLMLFLARATYATGEADPKELVDNSRFPDRAAIEDRLLDRFIPTIYGSSQREEGWLISLATQMQGRGQRDWPWWELPSTVSPLMFRLVVGVPVGLVVGLWFGLVVGLKFGLALGIGLGAGLGVWLAGAFTITGDLYVSPRRIDLRLRPGFMRRLAVWLVIWAGAGLVFGRGDVLVLGVGLVVGLSLWLAGSLDVTRATESGDAAGPISTFEADRNATILVGLGFGLVIGPQVGFLAGHDIGLVARLGSGLGFGLVAGLGSGLVAGLGSTLLVVRCAWPRFRLVHAWAAITGELPWSLMSFMHNAHERGVLRQVGALYQFRHARLQDRLARRQAGPSAQ